jgi:nucleoside-specific outer membrane channel protein Tsx
MLYGTQYKGFMTNDDMKAFVLSYTHASGWNYGDNFLFVDITRDYESEKHSYYAEWSPRLSISKLSNTELSFGPISDLSVASTFEFPNQMNTLIGLGVDFSVPHFAFLQSNLYYRDNPDVDGSTWQLTTAWAVPVKISSVSLVFDGFFDLAGTEGDSDDYDQLNFHAQPAVALDLGNFWGKADALFLGVEYVFWYNKYGVKDKTENNAQAMIRWVF